MDFYLKFDIKELWSIKNIFRLKKDNSVLTPEQLRKKEALMRKILTYVNVFIVALIALVLYMAYETYVDQPKAGDAISAIKDRIGWSLMITPLWSKLRKIKKA